MKLGMHTAWHHKTKVGFVPRRIVDPSFIKELMEVNCLESISSIVLSSAHAATHIKAGQPGQ